MALHSLSARKFVYVRILTEIPAEGGLPLNHQAYVTFNGFNSFTVLRDMAGGQDARAWWKGVGDEAGGWNGDRCMRLVNNNSACEKLYYYIRRTVYSGRNSRDFELPVKCDV